MNTLVTWLPTPTLMAIIVTWLPTPTLTARKVTWLPTPTLTAMIVSEEQFKKRNHPSKSSTAQKSQLVDAVSKLHIDRPQKSVRFDCPEGYVQVCSACLHPGHPAETCPNKKADHPSRDGGEQRGRWQSGKYRR